MTSIDAIALDAPDATAAATFYRDAFGLNGQVRVRE